MPPAKETSTGKRKADEVEDQPTFAIISVKKKARHEEDDPTASTSLTSDSEQNMEMQDLVLLQPLNCESTSHNLMNTLSLITSSAISTLNEDKKFWMEMQNAKLVNNKKFLQVKDAQFSSGRSILYIRQCYIDFVNIAYDEKTSNLRITGNPGIGKTLFSYYLLYQLALYEETVIYHRVDEDPILFSKEHVSRSEKLSSFKDYLDDPNVWYIVIGQKPKICKAKTILICSQEQHYSEFDRRKSPIIRYMPGWSWDEIRNCKKVMFNDLKDLEVWKLYKMWGGIPQFILANALKQDHQDLLQEAIDTCDKKILRYVGENASCDDISHKLVHISTNLPDKKNKIITRSNNEPQPYTQKIMKFASDYVGEMITRRLETEMRAELHKRLDKSKSNQFLDDCFKLVAHQTLRRGGKFTMCSLNSGDNYILTLESQDKISKISKIDEIKNGSYLQTNNNENFPSFDAIHAPRCLFKMTTDMENPIKKASLEAVRDKLSKSGDIDYYFVVPSNLYDDFQLQKFDVAAKSVPAWIKSRLKQYVVKIDLSA